MRRQEKPIQPVFFSSPFFSFFPLLFCILSDIFFIKKGKQERKKKQEAEKLNKKINLPRKRQWFEMRK